MVPPTKKCKLEVWGAQGGDSFDDTKNSGGNGGYSYGYIVPQDNVYYVCCGGKNGYNGGGINQQWGADGGGCTHIANSLISDGLLKSYVNSKSSILIVAGGGGGSDGDTVVYGGAGGGGNNDGGDGGGWTYSQWGETYSHGGTGGKQNSPGTNFQHGTMVYNLEPGFGYGGAASNTVQSGGDWGGGGGAGWYGGGGDAEYGTGGGGSGHLSESLLNGGGSNGVKSGNGQAIITAIP